MRRQLSHQHGLDKTSGPWEVVLKELGRSPDQVLHVGDHEIADHETRPSSASARCSTGA